MKRILLICAMVAASFMTTAQNGVKIADITGEYCEFTLLAKPFSGKELAVVYFNNEMQKLVGDDNKDIVSDKGSPVPFLNAFSEKGWEVMSVYEGNRGGSPVRLYLLHRKK